MIKMLYEPFQKWCENGNIYIISDTHFDDPDTKLMDPGWIAPEDHIRIINSVVHKNDTLIHLGDVGDPKYMSEIKAHKVLIMGNHDETATKFQKKNEFIGLDEYSAIEIKDMLKKGEIESVAYEFHKPFIRGYRSNGLFDEIYKGPLMIAEKILLSHEPVETNWCLNIHGHDHNGSISSDKYHLNLAANVVGFKVFDLGKAIKDGLVSDIDSLHRIVIDNAANKEKK